MQIVHTSDRNCSPGVIDVGVVPGPRTSKRIGDQCAQQHVRLRSLSFGCTASVRTLTSASRLEIDRAFSKVPVLMSREATLGCATKKKG